MATHRLPILGWGTVPDSTGEVFFQPFSVLATNDVWARQVCRFGSNNVVAPTIDHFLHGGFQVPKNYVGTASVIVVWTSTITSGAVRWQFAYRTVAGDDANSFDQTSTEETVAVDDNAPGAANRRLAASLSVTAANFAADEDVTFTIGRLGAHANDTMSSSAMLFGAYFQYNDV